MPLPYEVHDALRQIPNPSTRGALSHAFERWQNVNRTLTRAMLVGLHRIKLPAEILGTWGHLLNNPLLSPVLMVLDMAEASGTGLEYLIRRLARHYESHGRLTDETRKHFEELMNALAQVRPAETDVAHAATAGV